MTHQGFSLVETLVYLGLFSLLITGSVMSAYAISASSVRSKELSRMEFEGTFLLKKMERAIEHATVVVPIPRSESVQLQLSDPDTTYQIVEDELQIVDTDGARSLSPYDVRDLRVSREGRADSAEDPEYITISFSLVHTEYGERTFTSTTYLLAP